MVLLTLTECNSDVIFAYFSGLYMTKSMQTPGGGDLLMALLGPLTLTYGFTLFRQRSVSTHTLVIIKNQNRFLFYTAFRMHLQNYIFATHIRLLIQLLQIIKHHATEFGAVVPLAAIFSILITIIGGRQLGLHEFLTRSVAARSNTFAFAIPVTTAIGGCF